MKVKISAFKVASTDKKTITKCQDSFSVNMNPLTFAVADGVSQSFYPEIWAEILTENYVKSPDDFFLTDDSGNKIPASELSKSFEEKFQKKYESLPQQQKKIVDLNRKKKQNPAATFVGVRIDDTNVKIEYIGDSVLFYIDKTGNISKVCSMPQGEEGKIHFGNRPQYLTLDAQNQNGVVKTEELPLAEGTIFVMTDALAEWFDNLDDFRETGIEKLKGLSSHNQFAEYVSELRKKSNLKDDDTTLLIAEITANENNAITCIVKHIDDINSLKVGELADEAKSIESDLLMQKDAYKSLEKKWQDTESERNRLLELSKQQAKELSTLEKEKDSLSLQNRNLSQTNKMLSDTIQTLESGNEAMKIENENLAKQLQAFESKVKIMSDKLVKAEAFRLQMVMFLNEEFKV